MKEMKGQKKVSPKTKDAKPWEKMYAGKSEKPQRKSTDKADEKAPQYLDFLYLLPKKTKAKELGSVLSFLKKGSLEIWDEECVLEITTEHGTITFEDTDITDPKVNINFEDIRDSLEREDEKTLSELRMKQVISCDYEAADRELVRKVMATFIEKFGGKIGSDTEDFTPFLNTEEL